MSYSFYMKKLSTKWFNKWSKKASLNNANMLEAIENLESRLSIDQEILFDLEVKQ